MQLDWNEILNHFYRRLRKINSRAINNMLVHTVRAICWSLPFGLGIPGRDRDFSIMKLRKFAYWLNGHSNNAKELLVTGFSSPAERTRVARIRGDTTPEGTMSIADWSTGGIRRETHFISIVAGTNARRSAATK